ncbi:MAG: glycosyltransferase family 4 protein [Woeseiaceae bacterium]
MISVLCLSNLYPNAVQPRKGVFVRERLRHVMATGKVNVQVIAPVPWFPLESSRFGQYGEFARIPAFSDDDLGRAYHSRYFILPKIGAAFTPKTYAAAVKRTIAREGLGSFDVIDSHFMFPDGAAAVLLGEQLGIPVVCTARGSDLNVMPDDRFAGPWIRDTLTKADAVIGVSQSLVDRASELGAPASKTHVLLNGVDRERFHAKDRDACRSHLDFKGPTALVVGNLVPVKGQALAIEMLTRVPELSLVVVGRGPLLESLQSLSERLGVQGRVRFVAEITQAMLVDYYNAADVSLLPSRAEGMPNVVLESLACGTPVVACNVGGVNEIIGGSATSAVVEGRDVGDFAEAVKRVLARSAAPQDVIEDIAAFDWQKTASGIVDLFESLTRKH